MGMDVIGRKPTSRIGQEFRANIWDWGVVLDAITYSGCDELLGEKLRRSIAFNDGEGPEGQGVCSQMADKLDAIDPTAYDGIGVDPDKSISVVARFTMFLRECGGFQVY